ncbi:MAG: hypothetical protein LBD33_01455 [Puniceicoccales bacterium]|jgi:hypothetical protein|nr:hypothetical protein [Puniceicoccales bacterium]
MKFRCSEDNVDAMRMVSSFLKYSEQEQCLRDLQVKRQRLMKSRPLQERSAAECNELGQVELALGKYVEENFPLERLNDDGKICEEEISLDLVYETGELDQAPFLGISMARMRSLVEAVKKRIRLKLYRKKYPEDVEWCANKVVSSLVDKLLKKNREDVRREILVALLGFVGGESLPDAGRRDMRQGDFDSDERRETWGIAAPSGDLYRADGAASSPECGGGANRVDPMASFVGIDPQIRDVEGDARGYDLPEMPDADSDNSSESQELDVAAAVQDHVDELATKIASFVRAELFKFSANGEPQTYLQELSLKFLMKKSESGRSYEEERGKKSITELFHAYIERRFNAQSGGRRRAMSGSEDVSPGQFSKVIRSMTRSKVRNTPKGKEFVVKVKNDEDDSFEDAVTFAVYNGKIELSQ